MAGIVKLYLVGSPGGFMGSDGIVPSLQIMVGASSREWLEPVYLASNLGRLVNISTIVPAGPDDPNKLIDACIAFAPAWFEHCPSMAKVRAQLDVGRTGLDFDHGGVPEAWAALREEARERFAELTIAEAELRTIQTGRS